MFKWFTKSKKGFTIVELMIVLLLLSLGAFALINLFRVANRSFDKSEERYIKQEAVKTTAELLRTGSANVAAAQSADIFPAAEVVPAGSNVDEGYSYLFIQAVRKCKTCGEAYPFTQTTCGVKNSEGKACTGTGDFAGYFLYNQNKGQKRSEAQQVSDVPMYVNLSVYQDYDFEGAKELGLPKRNQCGVLITIAALEDDFEYEYDNTGKLLNQPESDDIYYSLDVAYHFPNMATNDTGITVNYVKANQRSEANLYDQKTGELLKEGTDYKTVESVDVNGLVLRIYADSILSGDNTNTSIAVPKLCFVATASYGYDSGEVGLLCDFRDNVLLKTDLGTAFVKAYYKLSPPVADFISEHEALKATVRIALKPVVAVAEYALNEDIRTEGAILLAIFMLSGVGVTATLVTVGKRRKKNKAQ